MSVVKGCSRRTNWHTAGFYGLSLLEAFLEGYSERLAKRRDTNEVKLKLVSDLARTGCDLGKIAINSTLCPSDRIPEINGARENRGYLTSSDVGLVRA